MEANGKNIQIFSYLGQILKCKDVCKMCNKYLWPLQTSTTSISHAFQRWLSLTASAVIFWTSVLICRWLTTDPTLSGILSFIFPILIIPILASIYAEVNYECSNVLKVICTFHSCNVSPYSNILWPGNFYIQILNFIDLLQLVYTSNKRTASNVKILVDNAN